jgi:hypothetical protein
LLQVFLCLLAAGTHAGKLTVLPATTWRIPILNTMCDREAKSMQSLAFVASTFFYPSGINWATCHTPARPNDSQLPSSATIPNISVRLLVR